MNVQTYMKIDCYLCGGSVEFPCEMSDLVIECPHCQQKIKLFAGAKSKGFNLNLEQKVLTAIALIAVIVTVFNAHWEVVTSEFAIERKVTIEVASIFSPPNHGIMLECRLLLGTLLAEWAAILAIYSGIMVLLKDGAIKRLRALLKS